MEQSSPIPMCPMSQMCKGFLEKPRFLLALIVPGILLVALGVTVLIEPRILLWLAAAILMVAGIGILFMAGFMRKLGKGSPGPPV